MNNNDDPITDKRTLKAMSRAGHVVFPAQYGGTSSQVELTAPMNRKFTYKGVDYSIDYLDGSILPFVFRKAKA